MTRLSLLAIAPELSLWLTPVWIVAVGVLMGLLVLLALWGICALLSRIALVAKLTETSTSRRWLASILGIDLVALLLFVLFAYGAVEGQELPLWFTATTAALSAIAAACILIGLSGRKVVIEVPLAIAEGVLLWVTVVLVAVASVGILATFVVEDPMGMLTSITRIPFTGVTAHQHEIPAPDSSGELQITVDEQEIPVPVNLEELQALEFESTERLEVAMQSFADIDLTPAAVLEVASDEPRQWQPSDFGRFLPDDQLSRIFVRNLGNAPATLVLRIDTAPQYPQMRLAVVIAAGVIAIILTYMLLRALLPKLSAIALSSCKSEINQFHFILLLVAGSVALLLFIYVPYHTFGEDIKMLKISGLELIKVLAIFVAVWAASKSLADEIEGRTALTVLSKPIGRREFILGKFTGIVWTILLVFLVLGTVFLVATSYKLVYDAYENASESPSWQQCFAEMVRILPGLVLSFMEAVLLAGLSVAFSTRIPTLANFLTCGAIYVLGHLTPRMVQSALGQFEPVEVVARLFATVFPVLDYFDTQASVAGGADIPLIYMGWSLVYCLVYGAIAMLLALVLFEDRDLA